MAAGEHVAAFAGDAQASAAASHNHKNLTMWRPATIILAQYSPILVPIAYEPPLKQESATGWLTSHPTPAKRAAIMLNLTGITVRLGGRTILDRATSALPPRSRVGLIGRNGAGKSTLMKVMIGQLDADEGSIDMPKGTRIGYIAQEAPAGDATPFETVLAADVERAALMAESEHCHDPDRLGELHERLIAIDAYTAPARAARILVGLGFDEEMQGRPLDSYSGGWKMRVALAALLFSEPDLLLLDEPSNHLDLEATLWLENFLKTYPAMMVVISHERDLLNNVVDNILHLEGGKTTLYAGGYDAFERQRAERAAQLAAAKASQDAQRAKLQDYIARNSARASTAKQAQSRAKALARMQPIAAMAEDPSLSFDFPSPDELRPPLVTLDMASVGYTENKPILERLNLRLDPDDRIALLGRNGNGKTTLARLLAAQLAPMEGNISASGKMRVGYFTQYQVEELDGDDTPLEHMTRQMKGASPAAVRGQLGRFGFSGAKATTLVGKLSGGEKARLALALITRDAPHMLILDEPTNHLDVDAREALVQALNAYDGAVVLVSHDRHMLELTADRLVLVDDGTARDYVGSIDDYTDMILGKNQPKVETPRFNKKEDRKAAAQAREREQQLRKAVKDAEADMAKLDVIRSAIDRAMFDPKSAAPDYASLTMSELSQRRARISAAMDAAEAKWVEASEGLEAAG
jgi:ATP-binding cassette, subfamily F, member 3